MSIAKNNTKLKMVLRADKVITPSKLLENNYRENVWCKSFLTQAILSSSPTFVAIITTTSWHFPCMNSANVSTGPLATFGVGMTIALLQTLGLAEIRLYNDDSFFLVSAFAV